MNRNISFDIARSISMLYIIGFWHLFGYTEMVQRLPWGEYGKNATLGLFMFVSGFILAKKYKLKNLRSILSFLLKRFIRIMPLFFIALMSYFIVGFNSLQTTFLALSGLSTFCGVQPPTLWFVSMIILFYYLFVLISGRTTSMKITLSLLVFLLFYVLDEFLVGIDNRFFYYWPCFSFGVILSNGNIDNIISKLNHLFLYVIVFVIVSLLHFYDIVELPFQLNRILISISGVFLILAISQRLSKIIFIVKISSVVSFLSMSAYLFHRQIIDIIEKFIYWPEDGTTRVLYLIFFCLPIVLMSGFFIQKTYDYLFDKLQMVFKRSR